MNWKHGIATLGIAATLGCATPLNDVAFRAGAPGVTTAAEVQRNGERGPYLDLNLWTAFDERRVFVANDARCREIVDAAEVRLSKRGVLGELRAGDEHCPIVGILSLQDWRDAQARRLPTRLFPRARADYTTVYRDEDVALLRGRFPLVTEVRLPGPFDVVAIIPESDPHCEGVADRQVGTLAFSETARDPFTLANGDKRCAVLGFAQPVEGIEAMEEADGAEAEGMLSDPPPNVMTPDPYGV